MIGGSKAERTLVLVESRADALAHLRSGLVGRRSLFVTFDWMTLEYLRRDEHAVFPHEEFIPRDVGMKYQEIMERLARTWHVAGDVDVSVFEGVSLAAPFYLELLQYFAYIFRYAVSFARAVYELEPDSVAAYLVPFNYPYLEHAVKREVITQVARNCGLPLTVFDSGGPQELRRLPEVVNRNVTGLSTGRRLFFRLVSLASGLVSLFQKRKAEILVCPEGIFHTPLFERYLERHKELGYSIVFPATSIPPRSLMLEMIRKGSRPFTVRGKRVGAAIREAVGGIRQDLEEHMDSPEWKEMWTIEGIDFSQVFSGIIRDVVLSEMEAMALFVSGCGREFGRRRITSIVLPSDRARVHRVLMEVARSRGVETLYFEHGLTKYRPMSSLDGKKGFVNRVICWGDKDRNVLEALGVDPKRIVSLTPPFLAGYVPPLRRHRGGIGKVLLLEHCFTKDHVNGVTYMGEEFLLKLCRGLTAMGVKEIRFKVHPGMTIQAYFQRFVESHGLDVRVFKNENLRDLIMWSDIVIGPISTAVLEVMLLGREYYCVDLEGLEWEGVSVFDGRISRIYSSVEEVLSAVRRRESRVPGGEELRPICGITEGTTREQVLDPILDYFQERTVISRRFRGRIFEVTV